MTEASAFRDLGIVRVVLLAINMGLIMAVIPMAIDGYLPSFPQSAQEFGVPVADLQASMTLFMFGFSIGQLIYGPLGDHYGHYRVIIIAAVLAALASLWCASAHSIGSFWTARFFQALFICAGGVISRSLVALVFPLKEAAVFFSFLALVFGISPILAPLAGGVIASLFGWRTIFYIIAFFSLLLPLSLPLILPSRMVHQKKDTKPITFGYVLGVYKNLLKDRHFLSYALVGSLIMGAVMTHVVASPGIYLEHYHLSSRTYSIIFGFVASGFILGSQMNRVAYRFFDLEGVLKRILPLGACLGLVLGTIGVLDIAYLPLVLASYGVFFASGMIVPNVMTLAITNKGPHTGAASSMFGALQFMGSVILTIVLNGLNEPNPWLYSTLIAVSFVSATLVYYFLCLRHAPSVPGGQGH